MCMTIVIELQSQRRGKQKIQFAVYNFCVYVTYQEAKKCKLQFEINAHDSVVSYFHNAGEPVLEKEKWTNWKRVSA